MQPNRRPTKEEIFIDVARIKLYKAIGESDYSIRKRLDLKPHAYEVRLRYWLNEERNKEVSDLEVWIVYKATMEFAKTKAMAIIQDSENHYAQIGALRTMIDAEDKKVRMGQSLGIYYKEPELLKILQKTEIDIRETKLVENIAALLTDGTNGGVEDAVGARPDSERIR